MRGRFLAAATLAIALCALVVGKPAVSGSARSAAPLAPRECAPDTTRVDAGDFFFLPQDLTIAQGTTVCWTNSGNSVHTVTRDGLFDSGDLFPGDTFSYTFDTPGTFPYV